MFKRMFHKEPFIYSRGVRGVFLVLDYYMLHYHMPNILDNSIPIENVHCLIYFLLG